MARTARSAKCDGCPRSSPLGPCGTIGWGTFRTWTRRAPAITTRLARSRGGGATASDCGPDQPACEPVAHRCCSRGIANVARPKASEARHLRPRTSTSPTEPRKMCRQLVTQRPNISRRPSGQRPLASPETIKTTLSCSRQTASSRAARRVIEARSAAITASRSPLTQVIVSDSRLRMLGGRSRTSGAGDVVRGPSTV